MRFYFHSVCRFFLVRLFWSFFFFFWFIAQRNLLANKFQENMNARTRALWENVCIYLIWKNANSDKWARKCTRGPQSKANEEKSIQIMRYNKLDFLFAFRLLSVLLALVRLACRCLCRVYVCVCFQKRKTWMCTYCIRLSYNL